MEHKIREREQRAADRAAGKPKRVVQKKNIAVEIGDPRDDMGENLAGIESDSHAEEEIEEDGKRSETLQQSGR